MKSMMTGRRGALERTLVLAALLAIAVGASAEAPAQRAVRRQQTESQIAAIEERLPAVQADSFVAESALALVRQEVVIARKLLARGDHRSAKVMADQAEALLKRVEPKGEAQP